MSQSKAPQQKGSITKSSKAAKEEGSTEVHTSDVGDDISIDGRVGLYQGLDMKTLDYVSMYVHTLGTRTVSEYTQLRRGTYQELDLKGREEEHHYQRTN